MTKKRRKANLCRAMKLAYGSLKTHYGYSVTPPKKNADELGDGQFAAEAIREYAEIILICACELEQITKEEKKPLTQIR